MRGFGSKALVVMASMVVWSRCSAEDWPRSWQGQVVETGRQQLVDERFYEKLSSSGQAFIGVIETIKGDSVVFSVEHNLRGAQSKKVTVKHLKRPHGDLEMRVGDRWLYAGPHSAYGSRWLETAGLSGREKAHEANRMGRLVREDDSSLGFGEQLQSCERAKECSPVYYGCSLTAARANKFKEATLASWRARGGDTAVNCEAEGKRLKAGLVPWPICHMKRCGMWSVE